MVSRKCGIMEIYNKTKYYCALLRPQNKTGLHPPRDHSIMGVCDIYLKLGLKNCEFHQWYLIMS